MSLDVCIYVRVRKAFDYTGGIVTFLKSKFKYDHVQTIFIIFQKQLPIVILESQIVGHPLTVLLNFMNTVLIKVVRVL